MFVRNAWYIAARSEELPPGSTVARTILDEPLVLIRFDDGELAALRDACIHRGVPLSLGRVVGNELQCKYHGARFRGDGTCVAVPGQSSIPDKAKVANFPLREDFGFIWVWLGDRDGRHVEASLPASLGLVAAPDMFGHNDLFESMKASYLLLNDNLFDITHAEFVHPETIGGEEVRFYRNPRRGAEPIDRGLAYEINDRSIHFQTHAVALGDEGATMWRAMMCQATGVAEWNEPVHFVMKVNWFAPCYTTFHIYVRPASRPDAAPVEFHDFHAGVPETEFSTHYFYRVAVNYGGRDDVAGLAAMSREIFAQDVRLLEAQQARLDKKDVFDTENISFKGDKLQLEGRRIIEKLLIRESSQ